MILGVTLTIELDREEDGRWIAEVRELPGVLAYGESGDRAVAVVEALAFRVLAEQLEQGELEPITEPVRFNRVA